MTTEPTTPTAADRRPGDPISVLLTSHWASILVALLFPLQMRGRATGGWRRWWRIARPRGGVAGVQTFNLKPSIQDRAEN